jgi:hypothetical protein
MEEVQTGDFNKFDQTTINSKKDWWTIPEFENLKNKKISLNDVITFR